MRALRLRKAVSSLLALAAVVGLSVVSITPVQAAPNATLGDLSAASPAANKYAGCVASVLIGTGVTFGSSAALTSDLNAIWPSLPAGVADTCRQVVDGNQPQVCVNPADPTTCPATGAANATTAADLAAGPLGNWKLVTDGASTGGYAQASLATSGATAPMATVTGTFTTPTSVCTTQDCTTPPAPGLWTDCGTSTCGQVTTLTISVVGRTPNGENGVKGHLQVVDGFGNTSATSGIFGNDYWGYGCPAECTFSQRLLWTCKDLFGAPAGCGGQTLTVSFTFDSGSLGGCGCAAPSLGQFAEIQLAANNLRYAQSPAVCAGLLDCLRYDDARLSYLDGSTRPTVVVRPAAAPSAVIDLASSNLGCLVGVDVRTSAAISCLDVAGAYAPLLQTAHAPVVPAPPPAIAASASPSGAPSGWEHSPVTVTLTASDDPRGPGIDKIIYSASGAQPIPATAVHATSTQVALTVDGTTTVNAWSVDLAGTAGTAQSVTVKLDLSGPVVSCATPSTAWSATDVSVACTAGDAMSGLADPAQSQFWLATAVAAGTETTSAATNSVSVCDVAGNCTTAGSVAGIKVDRRSPSITCAAAPAAWSGGDVSIACSATDGVSGLADPTQVQFTLATAVAAGSEPASAATNSVIVCDAAGNCATAGPISGIKVDRLAPSIIITAPAGSYTVGQVVSAAYSCTDAGSGVGTCTGTQPAGSPIDTAAAGPHTFTVDATDVAGNHAKLVAGYTVTAAPVPAPKPVCTDKETGKQAGDHENECEKHGAAVRPVVTPKPTATPKPAPTHKPATHGSDQKKDDKKGG